MKTIQQFTAIAKQAFRAFGIVICIALLNSAPARADDPRDLLALDLDTLMQFEVETVSSASKYAQKVTEAPASISIVTSDDINKYGYRTLADIVTSVRGFYTTNDRSYTFIGSRGFGRPSDYNTRILLMVDGHRMNDSIYSYGGYGEEFILDIDLIDRVEIVRGPGSSLYGTNAFFGVINVITRKGKDIEGVETAAGAARYDTYKGRVTYGNEFENGIEVLFSGTRLDSEGASGQFFEDFDDPDSSGTVDGLDTEEVDQGFLQVSYEDFTLQSTYTRRDKGIPNAAYFSVFGDPRQDYRDEQAYVDLKYEADIAEDYATLARVYYDWYEFAGDYPFDYSEEGDLSDIIVNRDTARGERWGAEVQLTTTALENNKIVFGSEIRNNFNEDQTNSDTDPYFNYLDSSEDSLNWGLYVQDEIQLSDQLALHAGARFDEYDSFGSEISPRAALVYQPVDETIVKLSFGQAFRAPAPYEQNYDDGGVSLISNPDLDPETIDTYEVVLEQYFNKSIRGALNAYYYEIDDLIDLVEISSDDLFQFQNFSEVKAHGFEGELEGKWSEGWRSRLSYTYQETEDQATGEMLTNSPQHIGKLNFVMPVYEEQLFAGIEVQYLSSRKTERQDKSDDYWVTNFTLFNQKLIDGVELSASIYNLFDESFSESSYSRVPSGSNRPGRAGFSLSGDVPLRNSVWRRSGVVK